MPGDDHRADADADMEANDPPGPSVTLAAAPSPFSSSRHHSASSSAPPSTASMDCDGGTGHPLPANHRGPRLPAAAMNHSGNAFFLSSSKDMAAFFENLESSPS